MKHIFFYLIVFIAIDASGQSLIGKWKPVRFKVLNIMEGNVERDSLGISDSLLSTSDTFQRSVFLELGKYLMASMKTTIEEYTAQGEYIVITTAPFSKKFGVYNYNAQNHELKRGTSILENEKYKIDLSDNTFSLSYRVPNGNKMIEVFILYKKI